MARAYAAFWATRMHTKTGDTVGEKKPVLHDWLAANTGLDHLPPQDFFDMKRK